MKRLTTQRMLEDPAFLLTLTLIFTLSCPPGTRLSTAGRLLCNRASFTARTDASLQQQAQHGWGC